MSETLLFSPMSIRGVELRNRMVVPPMHPYTLRNGPSMPPQFGYWLGTRAKRGFGTQPSTWQNGLQEAGKAT